jgi:hypothetical protein
MSAVNEFFTVTSFETLAGTALAVTVVSNTFQALTKKDPKIFAFVLSIALCALIGWAGLKYPLDYFIVFINGCFVYCTAMGINTQVGKVVPGAAPAPVPTPAPEAVPKNRDLAAKPGAAALRKQGRTFFTSW